MKFLQHIQQSLEEFYGAKTGLDIGEFIRTQNDFHGLGSLIVDQNKPHDIELAVLFDRDLLTAWDPKAEPLEKHLRSISVPFEEVSHFVYFAFNHNRGRSVTPLELEIQSEVDRILLAFHGPVPLALEQKLELLRDLKRRPYSKEQHQRYEDSRKIAKTFLLNHLPENPQDWEKPQWHTLSRFFHSDLAEKIHLSRIKGCS